MLSLIKRINKVNDIIHKILKVSHHYIANYDIVTDVHNLGRVAALLKIHKLLLIYLTSPLFPSSKSVAWTIINGSSSDSFSFSFI